MVRDDSELFLQKGKPVDQVCAQRSYRHGTCDGFQAMISMSLQEDLNGAKIETQRAKRV